MLHTPSDVHVIVAAVAAPVSSFNASAAVRVPPVALFQFAFDTTPALSAALIAVPLPTKSTLIALPLPVATALTIRVAVVECASEPLVPVTVSVDVPAGVLAAVVTFNVALPDPVIDAGVNDAVAFDGNPLTLRLTAPEKPFNAPVVTV